MGQTKKMLDDEQGLSPIDEEQEYNDDYWRLLEEIITKKNTPQSEEEE